MHAIGFQRQRVLPLRARPVQIPRPQLSRRQRAARPELRPVVEGVEQRVDVIAGDQKAIARLQYDGADPGPLEPGMFQQFPQWQKIIRFQLHPQQGAQIANRGEGQIQRRQPERLLHRFIRSRGHLAVLHQRVFHDPRQAGDVVAWTDEAER